LELGHKEIQVKKVGICLFDDPTLGTGGWSSVSGMPAIRISDYGSLSTDVLWVTNLRFNAYKKLGLIKSHHIYDDQFFRTSLKLLMAELGLSNKPNEACSVISEVLQRVSALCENKLNFNMDACSYRLAPSIAASIVKPAWRTRPSGKHAAELAEAFKQATQQNQNAFAIVPPSGSQAMPFVASRAPYYKWLLEQKVPIGSTWRPIKQSTEEKVLGVEDGVEIKGTKSLIARLKEWSNDECYFFRIRVSSIEPFYRPFATFGHGSWEQRHWATLPEIIEMARYSKIVLSAGFKCDAGKLDLPEGIIDDTKSYSYSYGIFLENVWNAIASPLYGSKYHTPIAAYMRAYDRTMCVRMAEGFANFNCTVGSAGAGRVMVYVRPSEQKEILEFASENLLCPPLDLVRESFEC
jgi:hypothetical protein